MIMDYSRDHDLDTSINPALLDIEYALKQRGLTCSRVGVPEPIETVLTQLLLMW